MRKKLIGYLQVKQNNAIMMALEEALMEYRTEHDCFCCAYYEKPRKCKGMFQCLMDEKEKEEPKRNQKYFNKLGCPKDKEGGCPYGNEVGTCFGFCWKDILKERGKTKGRISYEEEEKADGK